MLDGLRNDEALARAEFYGSTFKIDEQAAFDDIEEFVIGVVMVPMVLALDNAEAND